MERPLLKENLKQDKELTILGSKETTYLYQQPSPVMIERFSNPSQARLYNIEFTTREFTSLCPKTGQPDFASIKIDYVPEKWCIETKSLKLYLFAYRQHQSFMEAITNKIADDLWEAVTPVSINITASFTPRGGISPVIRVQRS